MIQKPILVDLVNVFLHNKLKFVWLIRVTTLHVEIACKRIADEKVRSANKSIALKEKKSEFLVLIYYV